MPDLNFLNVGERHHDFPPRRALQNLKVHVIGGDARDALHDGLGARSFDNKHQILIGLTPNDAEEIGKLGFKKPAVKSDTFTLPGAVGGIHVAETPKSSEHYEPQIYQRGQFTFNRRFFETKFSNFFSVVRREADKDLVFVVKTARAQTIVQRITRIASNDVHFEVLQGTARREIMMPFADIQEIQIRHKDA